MKIGIDAKWYFNGNPSGRIVVKNLLNNLIKLNINNEIYVILNKKDINENFPFKNNKIKLIYVWGSINLISNIFVVPLVLLKYKLDVCVFQYFAPIFGRFKKIVFIHDVIFKSHPEYFTLKEKLYFSPMKYLSKKTDGIITVSGYVQDKVLEYGFNGRNTKLSVVYNGVSNEFKPRYYYNKKIIEHVKNKHDLPDRFLLYVGRLNERKNILNLLIALKYLDDKNIKLVLCGKYDWKMFNLPQKIKELGLNDKVILLGHVADEDLPIIYSLASVFCYISFEEGFGLPPLESLATGVPVVVSKTSSLTEICGDAGIYCNPYDPRDIAAKIDWVLKDENLRIINISMGLKRVRDFNWENSASTLLKFCENIVEI